MAKEFVTVDEREYFACSVCHRPLKQGYDSPGTPGDVLCGPHYQEQYAIIYQVELAQGAATLPEVPDGLLEGWEELMAAAAAADAGEAEASGNPASRLLRRVRPGG